jgi:plastocyanin
MQFDPAGSRPKRGFSMRTTRHTTRIAAVAIALLLPLAACSKSDSGSSSSSGSTAAKGTITIKGFKFSPTPTTAKVGDTITVTNEDSSTHTFTSTDGPAKFDTGDIAKGSSKTVKLTKAGTYKYRCSIHSSMTGEITVK